MNSLKRPGIEDGGFLSHEPEDLHAFFEEIEYVMGPLDHAAKSGLKAIFHHHQALLHHVSEKNHELSPTKEQFGELVAGCRDLEGCIQKIQKNHSAMEAIAQAEIEDFDPAGGPGFNEVVAATHKALDLMSEYVLKAADHLPKRNRWPKKIVPLHDLIKSLVFFYEEHTGRTAKSGIKQDRTREDKYSGSLFNLIDTAVTFLDRPYNNSDLGDKIYKAINS